MTVLYRFLALATVLLLLISCGCQSEPVATSSHSDSPELIKLRQSVLVDRAPAQSLTLTAAAERWNSEDPQDKIGPGDEVVLTGRIHADGESPWEKDKASFMISILPEAGHDDPDHSDNCPFCKRKLAKAPKAIVSFQDPEGNVLPYDAQTLFDLQPNDTVTIRGQITGFDLNLFLVSASELHKSP